MHISSSTEALLPQGRYRTESRGVVWVKVRIVKFHACMINNVRYIRTITYSRIICAKGKGDMETYWLESAANDGTKEIDSSDDEDAVVEGLLVTSI